MSNEIIGKEEKGTLCVCMSVGKNENGDSRDNRIEIIDEVQSRQSVPQGAMMLIMFFLFFGQKNFNINNFSRCLPTLSGRPTATLLC